MLDFLSPELRQLLEHFLIPAALSLFACITRVCLWGWHGFQHFIACYCVGVFCGVCASWLLDNHDFAPTTEALIISLASLVGYDTLKAVFSRRNMARAQEPLGDRIVHEIRTRGVGRGSHGRPPRHEED